MIRLHGYLLYESGEERDLGTFRYLVEVTARPGERLFPCMLRLKSMPALQRGVKPETEWGGWDGSHWRLLDRTIVEQSDIDCLLLLPDNPGLPCALTLRMDITPDH